jgi:hypothetical protein
MSNELERSRRAAQPEANGGALPDRERHNLGSRPIRWNEWVIRMRSI